VRDFASVESILRYANERKSLTNRDVIVQAIRDTLASVAITDVQEINLRHLSNDNTLTVTCGHQLNVFGGPIYVAYKIQSVINLCAILNKESATKKFVPVFWLASEDHDIEEVSSFHFYGESRKWQTEQTGACGRMKPNGIVDLISNLFQSTDFSIPGNDLKALMEAAYSKSSLAEATVHLVNHWFGNQGLLILNPDNPRLKRAFLEVVKKDLQAGQTKALVDATSEKLKALGYHNQANAREVNYYYLSHGERQRIDRSGDGEFQIGSERKVSLDALIDELENNPGALSTNVITRPVYQEFALPNVVFVGGAGELSYWLQLAGAFKALGVPYPILLQRNSFMLVPYKTAKTIEKIGLKPNNCFSTRDEQIRHMMAELGDLDFGQELETIENAFGSIARKAGDVDFTLVRAAEAELAQSIARVDHLKAKMLRALKQKNETRLTQLDKVRSVLFPSEGLQERQWGLAEAMVKFSPDVLDVIKENADPLNSDFVILIRDDDASTPNSSAE